MKWLRRLLGTAKPANASRTVPQSRFEGAQTNASDYHHWRFADALSPNASASPEVRKILRERARFERDNDPHLNGLTRQLAHDLIGTGPRLQIIAPDAPPEDVKKVEESYKRWVRASNWTQTLRIMAEDRPVSGEVFAYLASNPKINHPVKLSVRPFECDLVANPWGVPLENQWDDGVIYDEYGNPSQYLILKSYPGDSYSSGSDYTKSDAENVLHWFRPYRAGQRRGVSDFASVLAVVGQLRRFSQAVLTNAEFAASIAGVIYSDGAPGPENDEDAVNPTPLDPVNIPQGKLLTMPHGWKADHFKGDQPQSTYKEYAADKRNEIARPTGAPFNVMSGNSSGYNYSSGRLDHVPYQRGAWIERESMRAPVLDRVVTAWLREAKPHGLIPASLGPIEELEWEHQWDGFNSIDPYKDAQASQLRLQIGLTTLAEECAAEGRNWRDVLEQQKVEKELRLKLGLTDPTAPPAGPATSDAEIIDDEDNDDTALDRPAPRRAERVPA